MRRLAQDSAYRSRWRWPSLETSRTTRIVQFDERRWLANSQLGIPDSVSSVHRSASKMPNARYLIWPHTRTTITSNRAMFGSHRTQTRWLVWPTKDVTLHLRAMTSHRLMCGMRPTGPMTRTELRNPPTKVEDRGPDASWASLRRLVFDELLQNAFHVGLQPSLEVGLHVRDVLT